jgi:hypothetical protein
MEAIRSSETSVLIRATRRHLPEDDNHHSHRRGNLKSYIRDKGSACETDVDNAVHSVTSYFSEHLNTVTDGLSNASYSLYLSLILRVNLICVCVFAYTRTHTMQSSMKLPRLLVESPTSPRFHVNSTTYFGYSVPPSYMMIQQNSQIQY